MTLLVTTTQVADVILFDGHASSMHPRLHSFVYLLHCLRSETASKTIWLLTIAGKYLATLYHRASRCIYAHELAPLKTFSLSSSIIPNKMQERNDMHSYLVPFMNPMIKL